MKLEITPLDFNADGSPRDQRLAAATQLYWERVLHSTVNLTYYARVWVTEAVRDDDTEYREIIGVMALRNTPDIQVFHVEPPSRDKEGMRVAEQARDLMVTRGHGYLQDMGLRGSTVLIYVSAAAQRYWRRFLVKVKIRPSDRFEMTI